MQDTQRDTDESKRDVAVGKMSPAVKSVSRPASSSISCSDWPEGRLPEESQPQGDPLVKYLPSIQYDVALADPTLFRYANKWMIWNNKLLFSTLLLPYFRKICEEILLKCFGSGYKCDTAFLPYVIHTDNWYGKFTVWWLLSQANLFVPFEIELIL